MFIYFRLKPVKYCVVLITLFASVYSKAQTSVITDTLSISLPQAEKQFVDSNFLLLAAHYNVDAEEALIEQAKVWQNPTINTDFMLGADGKFFNYGKYIDGNGNQFFGQYYIQLQQLILTAKKRGKLIDIATTNSQIAALQLKDIMRNLRYQLHQDYYTVQQQLALQKIYNAQALQLNNLLKGMQAQLNAGNIAQKDFVRIQALIVSLQQDILELNKSIVDTQNDLKTLLQIKQSNIFIKPVDEANVNISLPESLESLTNSALQSNPYYLLQQKTTVLQQQNVTYQKALRSPDITLGPNFDRNSNFASNYVGMGVSLPLPIFNKNKGNVKFAEANVKQQLAVTQNAEIELRNNISAAYQKLLLGVQLNSASQKDFYNKYQTVYTNMLQSYTQRQIGLLEFLDFYHDYTDLQQKLLQQQLNLQLANEELQYHIGK